MKFFSKEETIALGIIFLVLVVVSWPNFTLSLRRARDQIRRDDIGSVQGAIDNYYSDYGIFPASTNDGKLVVCKGSEGPQIDPGTGKPVVNLVPCTWGKDPWLNLTPGVSKVYLRVIPGDPDKTKGASYVYFSDGSRYQLMGALESSDEPGYDAKLAARGVMCGNRICNIGRATNVPLYLSIEEYDLQIYCGDHPKDVKCIGR